jgi:hypothetical protein
VVMSMHGLDILVLVRRVPELERHVIGCRDFEGPFESASRVASSAASWRPTHQIALCIEIHIHHGLCMPLDSSLALSRLPVPNLDRRIFARASQHRPNRMKHDARYGLSMRSQSVTMRWPREPCGRRRRR